MAQSTLLLTIASIWIVIYWRVSTSKQLLWRNQHGQMAIYCLLLSMTLFVSIGTIGFLLHTGSISIDYFLTPDSQQWRMPFLFLHILAALLSTFLGPFLFYKPYRTKYPKRHRLMGKLYVGGTLFSAVIVLPLATTNGGGLEARFGFTMMALLWMLFTLLAYAYIRKKNIVEHRRWMMRSYAMTFAFVHVNCTYKLLGIYGMLVEYPVIIKIMQSVVSWSINLIIVELYLAATTVNGKFIGSEKFWNNLLSLKRFKLMRHMQTLRK